MSWKGPCWIMSGLNSCSDSSATSCVNATRGVTLYTLYRVLSTQKTDQTLKKRRTLTTTSVELGPYRSPAEFLELELASHEKLLVALEAIEIRDCSTQAWLRELKTSTTEKVTTTTPTTTTTTEPELGTTASFLDSIEDFTVNRNDSSVTTAMPFGPNGPELPTDWSIINAIQLFTPPTTPTPGTLEFYLSLCSSRVNLKNT